MCELACFLSTLVVDVVLPVTLQRQALAVLFVLAVEVPQIQFFDVVGFRFLGMCVHIDKSLMCQWSCKAGSLSTGAAEEFHGILRAVSRYPHLDPGHYFYEPLYLAGTCPGVLASVYGCFWKNVTQYLRCERFAHGNLDTAFSSSRIWWYVFLRNTWFVRGYMFLVFSRWLLDEFQVFSL